MKSIIIFIIIIKQWWKWTDFFINNSCDCLYRESNGFRGGNI